MCHLLSNPLSGDGSSDRFSAPADWNMSQSDLRSVSQSVAGIQLPKYRHCELLIELQSVAVLKIQYAFRFSVQAPFRKQVPVQ